MPFLASRLWSRLLLRQVTVEDASNSPHEPVIAAWSTCECCFADALIAFCGVAVPQPVSPILDQADWQPIAINQIFAYATMSACARPRIIFCPRDEACTNRVEFYVSDCGPCASSSTQE